MMAAYLSRALWRVPRGPQRVPQESDPHGRRLLPRRAQGTTAARGRAARGRAPAPALRRPVPIRAKLGSTTYEKLAESTEYGVAEYRQLGAMQSTGYTWRPGCAEK